MSVVVTTTSGLRRYDGTHWRATKDGELRVLRVADSRIGEIRVAEVARGQWIDIMQEALPDPPTNSASGSSRLGVAAPPDPTRPASEEAS